MIIRSYADESYTDKAKTLCGFIGLPDEWKKMSLRWKVVLNDYGAEYFHFREFATRALYQQEGNAYFGWSEKQRERFLFDLALVLSETVIPVGCYYNVQEAKEKPDSDTEGFFVRKYYEAVAVAMGNHWPGTKKQVHFVFDETSDPVWETKIRDVHKEMQKSPEVGNITFENDKRCPPLQAADLHAYMARQNAEKFFAEDRVRQPRRTLDWLIDRNHFPQLKRRNIKIEWRDLARLVIKDHKKQMLKWKLEGQTSRKYYPEKDFDFEGHGFRTVDLINHD